MGLDQTETSAEVKAGVETYRASPAQVRAMERIFILHADHEQNASTSATQ